jgi:hypothetical protein
LDDAHRFLGARLDAVLQAQRRQNPGRHPSKGQSKIRLRSDFDNLGRRPSRLCRKGIELEQQDGFPDPTEAGIDEAPFVSSIT